MTKIVQPARRLKEKRFSKKIDSSMEKAWDIISIALHKIGEKPHFYMEQWF